MKRGANIVGRSDDTTRLTVRWDGWMGRPTDRLWDEGRKEGGRSGRSLARSTSRCIAVAVVHTKVSGNPPIPAAPA